MKSRTILPDRENLQDERFVTITRFAYIYGAMGHFIIGMTCYFLKVQELMWFNFLFSVPVFIAAYGLNRKGLINLAFFVAMAELLLHQVFAVYLLGWQSGAQYYLIYLAGLSFFNPNWKKSARFLILSTILSVFAAIYLFFRNNQFYDVPVQILDIVFLVNALSAILLLALLINYYVRVVTKAEDNLQQAHKKTRNLLLNILPEKIADQLEIQTEFIAESYKETSILFSDIVGFTKFSASLPAEEVVRVLNDVFSGFDRIVQSLGLEKIKTIGDGYMVASGIPAPRDDHAVALIECAKEMFTFLEDYNSKHGSELSLRVGINSGEVVAGIIGNSKFAYDLWGDTVNTASRMESNGIPGKIHLTKECHNLIKDSYDADLRGVMDIKGKGQMETYLIG